MNYKFKISPTVAGTEFANSSAWMVEMKEELVGYLNNLLNINFKPGCLIETIELSKETRMFSTIYLINVKSHDGLEKLILHFRKKPFRGELELSAMEKARSRGVSVPRIIYYCHDDNNPFEVPFRITEFIQGRQLLKDPAWLERNFEKFIKTLARIHLPENEAAHSPGREIIQTEKIKKYQVDCCRAIEENKVNDIDLLTRLTKWFELMGDIQSKTSLQNGRISLLHGDLHPTNLLITEDQNVCFLDWEATKFGDYCSDLACLKTRTLDLLYKDSLPLYNGALKLYSKIFGDEKIDERASIFLLAEYIELVWRSCVPQMSEKWLSFFLVKIEEYFTDKFRGCLNGYIH